MLHIYRINITGIKSNKWCNNSAIDEQLRQLMKQKYNFSTQCFEAM